MHRSPSRRLLLTLALGAALPPAALAQTPATAAATGKAIRLIVPYAPGGPLDATARSMAERAQATLGRPVIIDNKPGAGGNIGTDLIAKAPADGNTIGIAAVATHAINPWLFDKLPFDPARDFAPITAVARVPNVVVINTETAARLGINSLAELIAYAKKNPGKLSYGSGGNGSAGHLAGEMLKQSAGIFALHVPYNGASPAQLALLGGHVDFNIDNLASASANIKAGKLKPLAVTTAQASSLLPGVPPIADTLPGFAVDTWWGLVAPAGTPAEVIQKLNTAFTSALQTPEVQQRFATLMATPAPGNPQAFADLMSSERARYQSVVKRAGAKVD